MTAPIPPALQTIVEDLHGQGRLRVWSIIVSAFGDLVWPRAVRLPAPVLQDLMERLGVKPGAMRTALSRLVDDGWIERRREGRSAAYGLTPDAAAESDLAARRIYAPLLPPAADPIRVVVLPEGADEPEGLLRVRRGVYLAEASLDLPGSAMVIKGDLDQVPDWVLEAVAPKDVAVAFDEIGKLFRPLLDHAPAMVPVDAAAARVLLIHYWRRVVLRQPGLPAVLTPSDWPGAGCHELVAGLYHALSDRMESWVPGAQRAPGRFQA
ncbi:MAG: PaaX family transcriptional regulator C-terminal domain-containing protein [Pseudomonadota bacterium]